VVAVALSIALLGAACTPSSGTTGGPIQNRDWVLRAYADSSGALKDAYVTVPLSARFEGGAIKGSAGCSQYTASFTIGENYLAISDLQVGTETCDSYANEGRDTFMAALRRTSMYKVEGTRLTLYDKDGKEVLRFAEKP
jgi:heat shock protein HslJ